jgi:hypothetical protein
MPRLACFACGRQIYTTAPLDSLFAEERRCPRCGAYLNTERREAERRQTIRRENPAHDPGPPRPTATAKGSAAKGKGTAKPKARAAPEPDETGERRVAERRTYRRRGATSPRKPAQGDSAGWQD